MWDRWEALDVQTFAWGGVACVYCDGVQIETATPTCTLFAYYVSRQADASILAIDAHLRRLYSV